jgi:hypothetical protein
MAVLLQLTVVIVLLRATYPFQLYLRVAVVDLVDLVVLVVTAAAQAEVPPSRQAVLQLKGLPEEMVLVSVAQTREVVVAELLQRVEMHKQTEMLALAAPVCILQYREQTLHTVAVAVAVLREVPRVQVVLAAGVLEVAVGVL